MTVSAFPDRLSGDGFVLRRWAPEDAEWYVRARDEEIFRWTTEKRDLTAADTASAIRQINEGADALCLAVVDSGTGGLLGNLALTFDLAERSIGEVMYWLAPEGRGRGIASRSVALLCDWAFQNIGLARIRLKTLPENARSQRVAERAGFRVIEESTEYRVYEKRAGSDGQ